ncbi:MAG: hypothetical protein ACOYL6_18710 [Bacteriovoracaceae bacterium]
MKQLLSILLVLQLISISIVPRAFAESTSRVKKDESPRSLLRFEDFLLLARYSMNQQTNTFNHFLVTEKLDTKELKASYGKKSQFFKRAIKLVKKIGIREFSPQYLEDKCVFNQKDVSNLLSPVLTLEDDVTYAKKNRLNDVKQLYGNRFYKVIYELCDAAKTNFEKRISKLTFQDPTIVVDENTQEVISNLIFFPTIEGKTTFLSFLTENSVGMGFVLVAAGIGVLVGLTLPGIIIGVIYIAQDSANLVQNLQELDPYLYLLEIPNAVMGDDGHGIHILFTDLENDYYYHTLHGRL